MTSTPINHTTIDQLPYETIALIEQRMRPDGWSTLGFLTKNESLVDLISADKATLKTHQISYEQIADRLHSLMDKCKELSYKFFEKKVPLIEGKFLVLQTETKGFQICPFTLTPDPKSTDCGRHQGTSDYTVININTKERFAFSSLMPHLIGHHFFEGGPYRVDPAKAISFFDLQKEMSYKTKTEISPAWIREKMSCIISDSDKLYSSKICSKQIRIKEGVEAFVIDGKNAKKSAFKINIQEASQPLCQNLEEGTTYLFLTIDPKAAFDCRSKKIYINNIALSEFIMNGSYLFALKEKEGVILEENDTLLETHVVVFNDNGETVVL